MQSVYSIPPSNLSCLLRTLQQCNLSDAFHRCPVAEVSAEILLKVISSCVLPSITCHLGGPSSMSNKQSRGFYCQELLRRRSTKTTTWQDILDTRVSTDMIIMQATKAQLANHTCKVGRASNKCKQRHDGLFWA